MSVSMRGVFFLVVLLGIGDKFTALASGKPKQHAYFLDPIRGHLPIDPTDDDMQNQPSEYSVALSTLNNLRGFSTGRTDVTGIGRAQMLTGSDVSVPTPFDPAALLANRR